MPKIIDECCELVKLRHINRRGPFFETQCSIVYRSTQLLMATRRSLQHVATIVFSRPITGLENIMIFSKISKYRKYKKS